MRKKRNILLLISLSLLLFACEKVVDVEDKPDMAERGVNFVLQIVDSTGTLDAVYGNNYAEGASIVLQSNLLNDSYTLESGENGIVNAGNLVSGDYLISVSRDVTPEEMEIAYGEKKFQQSLINSTSGTIVLRADISDTLEISLDKFNTKSTLLISEIYSAGPPESGLYFHDKYVEIYNQSDEVQYLDGILIAQAYKNSNLGYSYVDDPDYVHSKAIWQFPGAGNDYPIEPGQFVICAEDGIDHTISAPYSVDLSNADFEFYKSDAPDIDYNNVPNLKRIYQPSGNDWLLGGEKDALVIARCSTDSLEWDGELYMIPTSTVLDGVEFLEDPTRLDEKRLYPGLDAGATGGISFYTGKTMERKIESSAGATIKLKDNNNSSLDFNIYPHPSPKTHNEFN